jgi:Ni,Fe-hydrogenase III component G
MNIVCNPSSIQSFQKINIKRSKKLPKRILKRIKSRKLKEKLKILEDSKDSSNFTIFAFSDDEYDMLSDIDTDSP